MDNFSRFRRPCNPTASFPSMQSGRALQSILDMEVPSKLSSGSRYSLTENRQFAKDLFFGHVNKDLLQARNMNARHQVHRDYHGNVPNKRFQGRPERFEDIRNTSHGNDINRGSNSMSTGAFLDVSSDHLSHNRANHVERVGPQSGSWRQCQGNFRDNPVSQRDISNTRDQERIQHKYLGHAHQSQSSSSSISNSVAADLQVLEAIRTVKTRCGIGNTIVDENPMSFQSSEEILTEGAFESFWQNVAKQLNVDQTNYRSGLSAMINSVKDPEIQKSDFGNSRKANFWRAEMKNEDRLPMHKREALGNTRITAQGQFGKFSTDNSHCMESRTKAPMNIKNLAAKRLRSKSPLSTSRQVRNRSPSINLKRQPPSELRNRSPRPRNRSPEYVNRSSRYRSRSPVSYRTRSPRIYRDGSPLYRSRSPGYGSISPGRLSRSQARSKMSRSPDRFRDRSFELSNTRTENSSELYNIRTERSFELSNARTGKSSLEAKYRSYRSSRSPSPGESRHMPAAVPKQVSYKSPYQLIGALKLVKSAIKRTGTIYRMKLTQSGYIENLFDMPPALISKMLQRGFELRFSVLPKGNNEEMEMVLNGILQFAVENALNDDVYVEARAHDDEMDIRDTRAYELCEYFRNTDVVVAFTPKAAKESSEPSSKKGRKKAQSDVIVKQGKVDIRSRLGPGPDINVISELKEEDLFSRFGSSSIYSRLGKKVDDA